MPGNDHQVSVIVRVLDQATDPLRRISQNVKNMSGDFQKIGSSIGAFSNKLGSAITSMDKMANSMYRFNMYTSSLQRNLKAISLIGLGGATALGVNSANKAIDFEFKTTKMMTKMDVQDPTGAIKKELDSYILNDLAQKSMSSPSQIADLGIVLGQGGISNKADMKKLLKDTTFFSEAVDTDPANAGKMLIASIKGFDLPMSKATQVTDQLATALNKSLLEADELPHAIGELAGRSKMLGQSFESSLTALMMGRDQGMAASQTAQDFLHGLRQLSQIGNEEFLTPMRQKTFEKAGIDTSFFDTKTRQLKEFPDIIASLETTLQKQGLMPNRENFYKAISDNGGTIPDGLLDKMSMMPLISKIFGAAGQAPLIMGLQAKYEEVNQQTGEKTGKAYYGSEALKMMQDELTKSEGAVQRVHDQMAATAKFQLALLSNVWSAAQIKLANDFLPVIKSASNELSNYIGGKGTAGALDRFNSSVKRAADNLKSTNPELASFIEMMGNLSVNTIKVGSTVVPTIKEIGKSIKDNFLDQDWGNSIWTLPYYAIKNGSGFIKDTATNNDASNKAISELPPELRDSANLTRGLIKGGVILVAAGAIVKIIELGFRAATTLMKGGKIGADIGKWIMEMLFGSSKKSPIADAMKNMAVTANVVNVYGTSVNNGGVPTGTADGLPPRSSRNGTNRGVLGRNGISLGGAIAMTGAVTILGIAASAVADFWNGQTKIADDSLIKSYEENGGKVPKNTSKTNRNVGSGAYTPWPEKYQGGVSVVDNIANFMDRIKSDNGTAISDGFMNINKSLQNVNVENRTILQFSPNITLSGNIKDRMETPQTTISNDQVQAVSNWLIGQSRRYDN